MHWAGFSLQLAMILMSILTSCCTASLAPPDTSPSSGTAFLHPFAPGSFPAEVAGKCMAPHQHHSSQGTLCAPLPASFMSRAGRAIKGLGPRDMKTKAQKLKTISRVKNKDVKKSKKAAANRGM